MILSIIYFILILGVIVLVHEFGHFFFAKLFGIYVYEFSIGMGPKLFSKKGKKGETTYSIRAIPIGGFCQLAGEGVDEDLKLPKDRLLQSKPVWQRFLVMFFGAGNNFLLAIIVLFFLGLITGIPNNSNVIPNVIESSPVYNAGMISGDKIIEINGQKIKTLDDIQICLAIAKGETEFKVLRDNKELTFRVTPLTLDEQEQLPEDNRYSYGIQFSREVVEHGFLNSIKYSFSRFTSLYRQMILTFKFLFTGKVSVRELSGPVGIYNAVDQTKNSGIVSLLSLLVLLSLNVGFVNLIPFPAFDGGRILFLIIEKLRGKPIKAETENLIHNIGFFILLGLVILVTINDIIKFF